MYVIPVVLESSCSICMTVRKHVSLAAEHVHILLQYLSPMQKRLSISKDQTMHEENASRAIRISRNEVLKMEVCGAEGIMERVPY